MCDFISIALPAGLTKSIGQWRRRGFALTQHDNPALKQALPSTHVAWLLTSGGCSCNLCQKPGKSGDFVDADRAIFLREDAAGIIGELAAMHDGSSFLYVHTYSGDVSTERMPIAGRSRRTPESLSSATEPVLRDELIEVTNRGRRKRGG